MSELNVTRFGILLNFVHTHANAVYCLYDNAGKCVEATYDTDYESDNGMDEDEEGYEEYHCISFQRTSDGALFEVNYRKIPIRVICGGEVVYD